MIRLPESNEDLLRECVFKEAEAVLDLILIQFGAENISVDELREKKLNERDPLKPFSVSCRRELQDLQRVI